MSVNGITISGFKEFGDKLNQLALSFPQDLDDAAKEAANKWEKLAERDAPINVGSLKGRISSYKISQGVWEVASAKEYSPYMEWGTKSRAIVPAELSSYASQFQGPTGLSDTDPKELIFTWAKQKGIDPKLWWIIWRTIKTKGVKPHPFFFIQRPIVEANLMEDLKQMIATI